MNAVPELPYAYGAPSLGGVLRARPEDFVVDELLGFEPSGAGDHVLLQVRKRGINTPDAARLIARHAAVPLRDIGYAGLKDRHAVTSQWFSVPLPGKPDPDWTLLNSERLTVSAARRHNRKLRRVDRQPFQYRGARAAWRRGRVAGADSIRHRERCPQLFRRTTFRP